ncbi:MAG: hypothetical protein ABTA23_15170 [Solibacillus sp.]
MIPSRPSSAVTVIVDSPAEIKVDVPLLGLLLSYLNTTTDGLLDVTEIFSISPSGSLNQ